MNAPLILPSENIAATVVASMMRQQSFIIFFKRYHILQGWEIAKYIPSKINLIRPKFRRNLDNNILPAAR